MNDIDLKTYNIDNMNIREIMSNTKMGNLNLKDLYLHLKYKFEYLVNNKNNTIRKEYILNNLENWEKKLILSGILSGDIIEKNLNRKYFNRDRGFVKYGKFYEDIFLTTLWVALCKIFEESTTLAFINNLKYFDGEFAENNKANKVNSTNCINSEPDFVWIKKDGSRIMVEQKCSYVENFSIKIRQGQMNNFERNYNDDIVILVKDESDLPKDIYYFYNYKEIKPLLKRNEYGGNVKYYVTKSRLSENNILPFKVLIDEY